MDNYQINIDMAQLGRFGALVCSSVRGQGAHNPEFAEYRQIDPASGRLTNEVLCLKDVQDVMFAKRGMLDDPALDEPLYAAVVELSARGWWIVKLSENVSSVPMQRRVVNQVCFLSVSWSSG